MSNLGDKFRRYKVVHWATLVIGFIICGIWVWRYTHGRFEDLATEIVVAIIWSGMIFSPKALIDVLIGRFKKK